MTAKQPDATPQEAGYEALRQRAVEAIDAAHPNGPKDQGLAAPELYGVIRIVSTGVLRQLQEEGVGEAGTLAIRLGEAAAPDDTADLSYVVAERYRKAQGMREGGTDANAQAQQRRMALLAGAAGETAVAVVGSVLNPRQLTPLVRSGRNAVLEYETATYASDGASLLKGLLDRAEEAARQDEAQAA
jgi:hypothetical protein